MQCTRWRRLIAAAIPAIVNAGEDEEDGVHQFLMILFILQQNDRCAPGSCVSTARSAGCMERRG